jgi:DNA-binding winged helix-turn-helix (wHTH) protein
MEREVTDTLPVAVGDGMPVAWRRLRFGLFELDVATEELRKAGRRVRLRRQPFLVLATLASRPGEMVGREELVRRVWPGGTFIDFDQGLNSAVRDVRAALGDDVASPRFVETLPRRGYRFLAPVQALGAEPSRLEVHGQGPGALTLVLELDLHGLAAGLKRPAPG